MGQMIPIYSIEPSTPFKVTRLKIGEQNLGMIDRLIRIALGVILVVAFAANFIPAPWSYLVALIGLILLITKTLGTCGPYSVLGINTLEKKG